MLKEGAFEPSSPLRHSAELANAISNQVETKPVLFVYSDGGPDHRVNYVSVKIALIALFRKLDLVCCENSPPIIPTEILWRGLWRSSTLVCKP